MARWHTYIVYTHARTHVRCTHVAQIRTGSRHAHLVRFGSNAGGPASLSRSALARCRCLVVRPQNRPAFDWRWSGAGFGWFVSFVEQPFNYARHAFNGVPHKGTYAHAHALCASPPGNRIKHTRERTHAHTSFALEVLSGYRFQMNLGRREMWPELQAQIFVRPVFRDGASVPSSPVSRDHSKIVL